MIRLQAVKEDDKELFWNINQKYLYEMTLYYPDEEDHEEQYINRPSKIKCLRLEGSNFRLGGIAPITRAVPFFLALNERIFLMRLAVSAAWQKEN